MTATTTQYASPTTAASSSGGGSTATFRTIRRTFWTDPYIESMPPARKLLYIYLFTSPHTNNLGVLNTTARRIAFETGMTEDEVKEHLSILEQQDGKVALDDGSCGGGSCGGLSILVVNFIKHQCTTSPKLVMSLRALFRGVESEKIKAVLIAKNPNLLDGMDTVSGTLSIRSGEIDQDQIQEKREEIRSFSCCGDGDGEKGKGRGRGRQGEGHGIAVTLLPPPPPPRLQVNTDIPPKQDRKGYVQYTPPSASPFPGLAVAAVEVVDGCRLQDIPLDLLEALQRDYPTIDVSKEIDRAREWARRHTSPEKPLRNAWRFITAWLRNAVAAATTTVREKEKGSAFYASPQNAHRLDDWASEKKNMTHGKGQTTNAPEKPSSWAQTPPPPQQQPQRPQHGRQHEAVEHHFPTPEQLEENAQRGLAFLARWKKEHGYGLA